MDGQPPARPSAKKNLQGPQSLTSLTAAAVSAPLTMTIGPALTSEWHRFEAGIPTTGIRAGKGHVDFSARLVDCSDVQVLVAQIGDYFGSGFMRALATGSRSRPDVRGRARPSRPLPRSDLTIARSAPRSAKPITSKRGESAQHEADNQSSAPSSPLAIPVPCARPSEAL